MHGHVAVVVAGAKAVERFQDARRRHASAADLRGLGSGSGSAALAELLAPPPLPTARDRRARLLLAAGGSAGAADPAEVWLRLHLAGGLRVVDARTAAQWLRAAGVWPAGDGGGGAADGGAAAAAARWAAAPAARHGVAASTIAAAAAKAAKAIRPVLAASALVQPTVRAGGQGAGFRRPSALTNSLCLPVRVGSCFGAPL